MGRKKCRTSGIIYAKRGHPEIFFSLSLSLVPFGVCARIYIEEPKMFYLTVSATRARSGGREREDINRGGTSVELYGSARRGFHFHCVYHHPGARWDTLHANSDDISTLFYYFIKNQGNTRNFEVIYAEISNLFRSALSTSRSVITVRKNHLNSQKL